MNKPQDSDIFGTRNQGHIPRIQNDEKVDPNTYFQNKMDAQYNQYSSGLISRNRSALMQTQQLTRVNENATFD